MLVKLKDVCTFIGGSQPPKSTFIYTPKEGYIRLVQIRDRLNDNWATYIPENSTQKKCKPHEILIGRYGPPIFQVFRGFNGAYNVALLKAIPKENVNNDFLYYLLQQEKIVDFVNTNSKRTAGQWGVDLNMLYEYEVYLPNIEKQNKIANILLNIDNQIERNNAMTKRLQDMILTRYSVMFQNKTNKNGLLKDICLLPSGHNFKPEIYNNYGEYKLITIKNVYNTFIDDINTDKILEVPNIKDYCYLNIGDILLSLTGNVGRISIVHSKNNLLNQRVSLLQAKENYKIYSYCLLKSQEYQFIMTNIARGTSQKNLSPIDVENLQIYIPAFEEIKTFNESTEKYFNEMLTIKQSTETLIKLKNKLLPLLINGQLEV